MQGDLIGAFDFCVYDATQRRIALRSGEVYRDLGVPPWVAAMWVTAPKGLPNVREGSLLIECRHPAGAYPSRTDDERARLGNAFGTLFCVFLQGTVLGWDTIEHDVLVGGERRDQIRVHEYTQADHMDTVLQSFGLDAAGVRTLCREDVLRFAVRVHADKGAATGWTVADFLKSGVSRVPYQPDFARRVTADLGLEQKLQGTWVPGTKDGISWLRPELYEVESEKSAKAIEHWVRRIERIGRERKWMNMSEQHATVAQEKPKDARKVFVVHGRNEAGRKAMFDFLRAIGLHPLEWSEAVALTKKATPFVAEILDAAFAEAAAIVVLMTPDDEGRLRKAFVRKDDEAYERELTPQARLNVLFEAGMAMGRCADRTVLVQLGKVRPFSDIGGRYVVRMNNNTERRQDFAGRLKGAGCAVNLQGTDWHTTGNFEAIDDADAKGSG